MQKNDSYVNTSYNSDKTISKKLSIDSIKTTNINILLNRVKLSKKKDLRKKIIFLSLLVLSLGIIGIFTLL